MIAARDKRLCLVEKLYQKAIWRAVENAATSKQSTGPVIVELDPTTVCDAVCPDCISKGILNQGRFTTERLCTLAEELVELGVNGVILNGGGEPLLHPGIEDTIRILGESGIKIGITTNGTNIDRHLAAIAKYASWTRVSVDAASAGNYARFRPHSSGRNAFVNVIENMRRLALAKQGDLGFSFLLLARLDSRGTVIDSNFEEVYEGAVLAKEIGCDYFEVKPVYDMRHFLIRQPEGLVDELKRQLEKAEHLEDEEFHVVRAENLGAVILGEDLTEPKEYDRCLIAELRTLITPTGAYICPYFRGDETRNYGNPIQTSFRDLWNGSKRQNVMETTIPSRDCLFHCIRHRSNQALYRISAGAYPSDLVEDFDLFI